MKIGKKIRLTEPFGTYDIDTHDRVMYYCLHSRQSVTFDLYDKLRIAIGDINHDVFRDLIRQGI